MSQKIKEKRDDQEYKYNNNHAEFYPIIDTSQPDLLPFTFPHSAHGAKPYSPGTGITSLLVEGGSFQGRHTGYANRSDIFGTARFGSGFADGDDVNLSVHDRNFPFGFWPIYWGKNGYGGSGEYSNVTERPGWEQQVAVFTKDALKGERWFILGDHDSIDRMRSIIGASAASAGCNATTYPLYVFDPDDTSGNLTSVDGTNILNRTTLRPENVVQWYRGSSFALLSLNYTNQAAKNNNTAPITAINTPLNVTDRDFLSCINETIGKAVPILDSFEYYSDDPFSIGDDRQSPLSGGAIAAIVVGALAGSVVILSIWYVIAKNRSRRSRRAWVNYPWSKTMVAETTVEAK